MAIYLSALLFELFPDNQTERHNGRLRARVRELLSLAKDVIYSILSFSMCEHTNHPNTPFRSGHLQPFEVPSTRSSPWYRCSTTALSRRESRYRNEAAWHRMISDSRTPWRPLKILSNYPEGHSAAFFPAAYSVASTYVLESECKKTYRGLHNVFINAWNLLPGHAVHAPRCSQSCVSLPLPPCCPAGTRNPSPQTMLYRGQPVVLQVGDDR